MLFVLGVLCITACTITGLEILGVKAKEIGIVRALAGCAFMIAGGILSTVILSQMRH